MKKYKKNYNLVITDNMGNLDEFILTEEISLLLPYADKLLGPVLKKELTKKAKRSRVSIRPSAKE